MGSFIFERRKVMDDNKRPSWVVVQETEDFMMCVGVFFSYTKALSKARLIAFDDFDILESYQGHEIIFSDIMELEAGGGIMFTYTANGYKCTMYVLKNNGEIDD